MHDVCAHALHFSPAVSVGVGASGQRHVKRREVEPKGDGQAHNQPEQHRLPAQALSCAFVCILPSALLKRNDTSGQFRP